MWVRGLVMVIAFAAAGALGVLLPLPLALAITAVVAVAGAAFNIWHYKREERRKWQTETKGLLATPDE